VLRGLALPIGPLIAFAVGVLLAGEDREAHLGYYAAIAQILPLLLLVLILEERYFFRRYEIKPGPPPTRGKIPWIDRADRAANTIGPHAIPLFTLAFLGVGEWLALDALASRSPQQGAFAITVGALLSSFTAICLVALLGRGKNRSSL
jgi:hypothetical protein